MDDAGDTTRTPRIIAVALAIETLLSVVGWGLGTILGVPVLDGMRLDPAAAVWIGLAAVFSWATTAWSVRTGWRPVAHLRRQVRERVAVLFAGCSSTDLLAVSLAAGIGEEIFFRGFLQNLLGGWLGPAAGLLLASALFGALHWLSPVYALLAGLSGAAFGGLYLLTGNLLVPIAAHAIHDAIGFTALRRLDPP